MGMDHGTFEAKRYERTYRVEIYCEQDHPVLVRFHREKISEVGGNVIARERYFIDRKVEEEFAEREIAGMSVAELGQHIAELADVCADEEIELQAERARKQAALQKQAKSAKGPAEKAKSRAAEKARKKARKKK